MVAPTQSGIETRIAPLPAGALVSHSDLVRASGVSPHEFEHAIRDAQCPPLPHGFRIAGQANYDSALIRSWLAEFAAFREGLPALEKHREQERAKARFEANQRRLHEENKKSAWAAEQAEMIQDAARQNALEAEGKDSGRGGSAIGPFSGGSV